MCTLLSQKGFHPWQGTKVLTVSVALSVNENTERGYASKGFCGFRRLFGGVRLAGFWARGA
ncbi:hypothetical protein KM92DES2_11662 [uncultured Desulfovibrio sp.]|uniref:Uncharacterized protein n=1 Tax=uncultured Desulfovibrio sp. TaxID=167968 RepID=A0A212JSK6_9BACT|nr:hypothetical protein KM92DES2_11662 [uncultured Desulfovibrio sp.]